VDDEEPTDAGLKTENARLPSVVAVRTDLVRIEGLVRDDPLLSDDPEVARLLDEAGRAMAP
jgi:hypothetical protein